jgi:hypothetical protein
VNPRQGKRKRDRWGPCKECGLPSEHRCDVCGNWRCFGVRAAFYAAGIEHGALRKVKGSLGLYRFKCKPACRLRMRSVVLKEMRGAA